MPPLPKRKYAKARRGDRRAHMHLTLPNLSPCPQCHIPKPPHQVCPGCGYYAGRDVLALSTAKEEKA